MESKGQTALRSPVNQRKQCTVTLLEASLVASQASIHETRSRSPTDSRIKTLLYFKSVNSNPITILPRISESLNSESSRLRNSNLNDPSRPLKSPVYKLPRSSESPTSKMKSRRCRSISKDKNREYLQRLLSKNMNVCYITNLKSYIRKLKDNYNCDSGHCEMLQERLYNHRLQYHPEYFNNLNTASETRGNGVQTKITLANLGHLTISIESKPVSTNTSRNDVSQDEALNEDNERKDDERKHYRLEVDGVVKRWVKKIPFHPNEANESVQEKEHSIQNLINYIYGLISAIKDIDYEDKVKNYTDDFLDELEIWYPGPKRDLAAFKEGLREDLNSRINKLNRNFFAEDKPTVKDMVMGDITNFSSNLNPKYGLSDFDNRNKNRNKITALESSIENYGSDRNNPNGRQSLKPNIKFYENGNYDDKRFKRNRKNDGAYINDVGETYIADSGGFRDDSGTNTSHDKTYRQDNVTYKNGDIANNHRQNKNGKQNLEPIAINISGKLYDIKNQNDKSYTQTAGEDSVTKVIPADNGIVITIGSENYEPIINGSRNYKRDTTKRDNFGAVNMVESQEINRQGQFSNNYRRNESVSNPKATVNSNRYANDGSLNYIKLEKINDRRNNKIKKNYESSYSSNKQNSNNTFDNASESNKERKSPSKNEKSKEMDKPTENHKSYKTTSGSNEITKYNGNKGHNINNSVKHNLPNYELTNANDGSYRNKRLDDIHKGPFNYTRNREPIQNIRRTNEPNMNNGMNYVPLNNGSESYDPTTKYNEVLTENNDTKYATNKHLEHYQSASGYDGPKRDGSKQYGSNNIHNNYGNRSNIKVEIYEPNAVSSDRNFSNETRSMIEIPSSQEPNKNTYNNYEPDQMIPPSYIINKNMRPSHEYDQSISTGNHFNQNTVPNYELSKNLSLNNAANQNMLPGTDKNINKHDNIISEFNDESSKKETNNYNSINIKQNSRNINIPITGVGNAPNFSSTEWDGTDVSSNNLGLKCTLKSEDLCTCPNDKKPKHKDRFCGPKVFDMEKEVAEWLKRSSIVKQNGLITNKLIIDTLLFHLAPYLGRPPDQLSKAVLKGKIINILKGLGLCTFANGSKKIEIFKFCEDLANRLIGIQSRLECTGGGSWKCDILKRRPYETLEQVTIGPNEVLKINLKQDFMQEIKDCLRNTQLANDCNIQEEISDLLIHKVELIRKDITETIRVDVINILRNTNALQESDLIKIANSIIQNAKEIITCINNINNRTEFNTTIAVQPILSEVLSIYTSKHEIAPSFATVSTSIPKKITNINKINPEEEDYIETLANEVRIWMKTIPNKLNLVNDDKMIELMIYDLAGEIADHIKLEQLVPNSNVVKKSCITMYIYKWIMKFGLLRDLIDAEPHTQALVKQIKLLSVPSRKRFMPGKRKIIKIYKEKKLTKSLIPKAKYVKNNNNVLENQISTWVKKHLSNINVNNDKSVQIHELAEKIRGISDEKQSKENIEKEAKKWLKEFVQPKEQNKIDRLLNSLMKMIKKFHYGKTKADSKVNLRQENASTYNPFVVMSEDADFTMRKLIIKYIERSCETDDILTKGAYAQLLQSELQKLCLQTSKHIIATSTPKQFSEQRLNNELEYVKNVSDWLKNMPLEDFFNTEDNKDRVELVISLAQNIADSEEERKRSPDAMGYNVYISGIICQFLKQLPILKDQRENVTLMIDQLLAKIIAVNEYIPQPIPQRANQSVAEIIEDYIRLYGQEIVYDELKSAAWSACLLQAIKKMICVTKGTVMIENGVTSSTIEQRSQSVKRFCLELDYAYHISDWVKNLPLTGPVEPTNVSELAEKIAENDSKKINEQELGVFIKQWIKKIPLDPQKEVDFQLVVKQLMNRKDKIRNKNVEEDIMQLLSSKSSTKSKKSYKSEYLGSTNLENPGVMIVHVVENWCDSLPLDKGTSGEINNLRTELESKLIKKIAELNFDPRCSNNDSLFRASLANEIDSKLSDLRSNIRGRVSVDSLKTKLLDNINEARFLIKNITAGDTYKQKLEDTIELAFPNPNQAIEKEPGFQLYKSNLADLFIIENFDHVNDAIKLKCVNKIKTEINKYFQNAQERNTVPLPKEQLFNNMFGALYSVLKPDYASLSDKVEEIKTKCEIDDWYKTLPTTEPKGKLEYLELHQKIAYLAKELHQIEKETNVNDKMRTKITKWLRKVPLVTEKEDNNISTCAKDLIERLKNTKRDRKCVKSSDAKSRNSKAVLKISESFCDIMQALKSNELICFNPNPYKVTIKPADIILKTVEEWSNNVPLPSNLPQQQAKIAKDTLSARIIIKICELNSDPSTFNDDIIYNHLLEQELDKLLAALPLNEVLTHSKGKLKNKLIGKVNSIKPLVLEEKARHVYRKELGDIIKHILDQPEKPPSVQVANFATAEEEIINYFIEYQYNRTNEEVKQFCKNKIFETLAKFNANAIKNSSKRRVDTLQQGNHLICELSKIPPLSEKVIKEEVEEIRIKREVNDFLNKFYSSKSHSGKNSLRNTLKTSLAKQLHDIVKTGYTESNVDKMKLVIYRTLKRLGNRGSNSKINAFIEKLRDNERVRKITELKKHIDGDTSLPVKCYGKNRQDIVSLTFSEFLPSPNLLTSDKYPNQHQPDYEFSAAQNMSAKTAIPVKLAPLRILTSPEDGKESWSISHSGAGSAEPMLQKTDAFVHDHKTYQPPSSHTQDHIKLFQHSKKDVRIGESSLKNEFSSPLAIDSEVQSFASSNLSVIKFANPQPFLSPVSPKISTTRQIGTRTPSIQPPILIHTTPVPRLTISPQASFLNPVAESSSYPPVSLPSSSYQSKRSSVQDVLSKTQCLDVLQRPCQPMSEIGIKSSEPRPSISNSQRTSKQASDSSGLGIKAATDQEVYVPPDAKCFCDWHTMRRAIPVLEFCESCNSFIIF